MRKIILLSVLVLATITASAQKKRVFYDSKSDIIGISGHTDAIITGYDSKFFKNEVVFKDINLVADKKSVTNKDEIVAALNAQKAGNKILKYILNKNGYISFERLDQRSLKNVSKAERELAEADEHKLPEEQLKDAVAPQFSKNYIYYECQSQKASKKAWIILKAVMDESTFERVWNIISSESDMEHVPVSKLDEIDVPIVFVETGVSPINSASEGRTLRDIGHKVPDFAVRGQIVRSQDNAGLYAACGTASGAQQLDQMYIYRQYNKNGENYSKKIATSRVVDIEEGQARLFTVSGGWANSKKGDIAVLHHDAKQSSNVLVGFQNKAVDLSYQHETLLGMNKHGMSSYVIARLSLGWFLPSESKLDDKAEDVPTDMETLNEMVGKVTYRKDHYGNVYMRYFDNWNKPLVAGLGVGYGASWSLAHMIELEPYALIEAQYLYGSAKEEDTKAYNAFAGRIPVGLKVNLNIPSYKAQLTAGIEYNVVHFGYNKVSVSTDNEDSKSTMLSPYSWWNKGVAEPNSMRRTGVHFYLGLRFNY